MDEVLIGTQPGHAELFSAPDSNRWPSLTNTGSFSKGEQVVMGFRRRSKTGARLNLRARQEHGESIGDSCGIRIADVDHKGMD